RAEDVGPADEGVPEPEARPGAATRHQEAVDGDDHEHHGRRQRGGDSDVENLVQQWRHATPPGGWPATRIRSAPQKSTAAAPLRVQARAFCGRNLADSRA